MPTCPDRVPAGFLSLSILEVPPMLRLPACLVFALAAAVAPLQAQRTAFTEFTLHDGTGRAPVTDAVLLVRDGRIEAVGRRDAVPIPADASVVRLGGGAHVMPGLINAHGHVTRVSDLSRYAAYGVTTVWSLGDEPDAVMAVRAERGLPAPARSRVWAAGPVLAPTSAEEARAQVAAAAARGVDIIKIRVDDNLGATTRMPPEVYRAVIDAAHAHGLRVAAHLYYAEDARGLLDAGVDFLAHSVRDVRLDTDLVRAVSRSNRCYTPTFMREVSTYVYGETPDFFSDPQFLAHADPTWIAQLRDPARQEAVRTSASARRYRAQMPVAIANLAALHQAGVPIALGTDTGPTGRFQGYFELMELELLVDAGLSTAEALASATRVAAGCMGVADHLGTLEVGKWADFLVLDADPLTDIRNVRRQRQVLIGGAPVALPK
jgi:imidazolonepropionase-like amidohydrolase